MSIEDLIEDANDDALEPTADDLLVEAAKISSFKEWIWLYDLEKYINRKTKRQLSVSAFNKYMAPGMKTVNNNLWQRAKKAHAANNGKGPGPKKPNLTADHYYHHEYNNRHYASNLEYDPTADEVFENADGDTRVNKFSKDSMPTPSDDWKKHPVTLMVKKHIEDMYPHDHDVIIQWMAHNIQYPGVKILWAILFYGLPGTGKSTISNVISKAMGQRNVQAISLTSLDTQFNVWQADHCVGFLEELKVDGQNRHVIFNKLKEPISNPYLDVNAKGQPPRRVKNVQNYMGFTNHDQALPMDLNDRRWFVVQDRFTSTQLRDEERPTEYWDNFYEVLESDGAAEALAGWLHSIDLSSFKPNQLPKTTFAKEKMAEATREHIDIVIEEIIEQESTNYVGTDVLSEPHLREVLGRINKKWATDIFKMKKSLERLGWQPIDNPNSSNGRFKVGGIQSRVWVNRGRVAPKNALKELKKLATQEFGFEDDDPLKM